MTSWPELAFTVVGWFALVFSVFWLGRMWERDHPKRRRPTSYISDFNGQGPYRPFRVRRAPYDWTNEN